MPKVTFNKNGEEIPDNTKLELPLGFKKPLSLTEQVRQLIRSEAVREAARASGHETFEEADDFDTGEDLDPRSPYEEIFDPSDPREVVEEIVEKVKKKRATKAPKEKPTESSPSVPEGKGESPPPKK